MKKSDMITEQDTVPKQSTFRQTITKEYEEFQRSYGNIAEATLKNYMRHLERFFDWLDLESSDGIDQLDFQNLQQFVRDYQGSHGRGSQRNMHCSLRSFLGFCHLEGHLDMDHRASIPAVIKRELANVPFILDDQSLAKLFSSIDRTSVAGKRDYAMLKLMEIYGIRGIQLRLLKLEDIFWRQNRILFPPAKGGMAVEQPLLAQAGDPLLDYLQGGRPQSTGHPEVFLTIMSPFRPLADAGPLTGMVARRLQRAGIQLPENTRKGSHLFRHLFASKMLDCGTSLTHIADMLGHRNVRSTMTYTKIDFEKLTCVAQDWPEEDLKGVRS